MLSHVRLAFIGQREGTTAAVFVGTDQALILQLLKGRVDRAWAGLPGPSTAFGNLLDDLVPVHRALSQHGQDRRPHVASAGLRRAPTRSATKPGSAEGRLSAEKSPTPERLGRLRMSARHHR